MPTELERRARELLAAELDREADSGESRNIIRIADMVREGVPVRSGFVEAALRAITAALQAQQPGAQPPSIPEPSEEDVRTFIDAVSQMLHPLPPPGVIREGIRELDRARLRERIGQAPWGDGDA